MSGFAGIVGFGGAPVEESLLQGMIRSMVFRGPDAQQTWLDGSVGLAHTLLANTPESVGENQPCTLDRNTWIVGDVRLDGREDLIGRLESGSARNELKVLPDIMLVAYAWHAWGRELLSHLIGDFAFAIWDKRARRLFCARDQIGVKRFFYACTSRGLAFTNTLDCLHQIGSVSTDLNDQAVGDFLLFGYNADVATTIFRGIRQLPPAHALELGGGKVEVKRYWSLPVREAIRYRRELEYTEHFLDIFGAAISDRVRSPDGRIGVAMSGGMDSTSVGAMAWEMLLKRGAGSALRLFTTLAGDLWPEDREGDYASEVSRRLGVPIEYQMADVYEPFQHLNGVGTRQTEPVSNPMLASFLDRTRKIASHGRIALTGEGGDLIMSPSTNYLPGLLRQGQWFRFLMDSARFVSVHRQVPPTGIRGRLKKKFEKVPVQISMPPWLDVDFVKAQGLRERWKALMPSYYSFANSNSHPIRPESANELASPLWPNTFDLYDPNGCGLALEVRHPFFDLRLLSYILRVPPVPWCHDKHLLRVAMRGRLPGTVLNRPKGYPQMNPHYLALRRLPESRWQALSKSVDNLPEYINSASFKKLANHPRLLKSNEVSYLTLPVSLALWKSR